MNDTIYIMRIILSLAFIVAALMKIFGAKPMKKLFADFKLNRAAMVLIGMIEILLVAALYIQNLSFYASIGLAYICTTALFRHIKANHPFIKYIPTVVLLILSMITAVLLLNPN
jgi:uncharacterized membrane protein YphA (DoxX/SURF4 family)